MAVSGFRVPNNDFRLIEPSLATGARYIEAPTSYTPKFRIHNHAEQYQSAIPNHYRQLHVVDTPESKTSPVTQA